jgi:hypothetical protein
MRKTILAIAAGAAMFVSGAALADSSQVQVAQNVSVGSSSDARYCEVYYHEGILVRTHTCYTKAAWDARHHYLQDQITMYQLRSSDRSGFR